MSSYRRRSTDYSLWQQYKHSESTFYIEHYCPACKIEITEVTDAEWRPEGDELDLGTCGCRGC